MLRQTFIPVLLAASLPIAGCASPGIPTGSLTLPKLPASVNRFETGPVDTYTLVARGATACWFGAAGPLRQSHIFYADVEPPSRGGKADIAVFERDPVIPSQRGPRAYRIAILPVGSGSEVEQENFKLPDPAAAEMRGEVLRWASGDVTCTPPPASAEGEKPAEPAKAAPGTVAKSKKSPSKPPAAVAQKI